MPELVEALLRVLVVIAAFLVLPLLVGQAEHKAMAHMQSRRSRCCRTSSLCSSSRSAPAWSARISTSGCSSCWP